MPFGGRRGIQALAVLLVVLLVAGVLLPLTAQAAQITGEITRCETDQPVGAGATVTLVDVNGIVPPRTAVTNGAGVYVFDQPPPGSYTISATAPGHYRNESAMPARFDGSGNVDIPLCMYQHGGSASVLTVTVLNGAIPVPDATVAVFQEVNPTGRVQLVTQGVTNSTGVVRLTVFDAAFVLRTTKAEFDTVQTAVTVSGPTNASVNLSSSALKLFGQVRDANGAFLGQGVVAWLYDPTDPLTRISRLIPATVRDSFYQFEAARVPDGPYILIVDADRNLSRTESISLPLPTTPPRHDVVLQPAPRERYETLILYGTADWNNLTVWRNVTLNADSTLPGLGPPDLRDLRLQIDATLGNGNGALDGTEPALFANWTAAKGPAYVTTDGFFTTNGKSYESIPASFSATVSPTLTTLGARVWINTTVQYKLKGTPPPWIVAGAKSYDVTMTVIPDSDVPAYKDYVFLVHLPRFYEMNNSATRIVPPSAPVTVANFTRFTVDPGVMPAGSPFPQAQMKVEQSLRGIARAKVIAPAGKFHEANRDFRDYQVFVANNTEITYSAETSFHPIQPVDKLNYTWTFRLSDTETDTRWNFTTKYKFTRSGEFTVNLTMREGSGNFSYRDFKVFVDDTPPVAQIRSDRTGSGNANGTTLRVDEDIDVRFNGTFSTDVAFPGKNGVIPDSGFAWDFDGNGTTDRTGRTVTWAFQKPGIYNVSLTVTDGVGWKGVNATLTARVNDTTAPVPAFDILDPENDWVTITSPMERKTIALNASKTTDNFDKIDYANPNMGLNFTWTIPGPVSVGGTPLTGTSHTLYGVNSSFAWDDWNQSYMVRLTVRDTGFRGGDGTPRPNFANLTRNVSVSVVKTFHAELKVDLTKLDPTEPEDGGILTATVNVTNKEGWATASNVLVEVYVISGGVSTAVPVESVRWFRGDSEILDPSGKTIPAGTTVTLVITTRLTVGQGNKTLQVFVRDSTEPYTMLTDNRPRQSLNIRQPWWLPYAIAAAVIAIIALAVFGMYARRKIKAGEWRPIRGRRGEKGGAEEKERPRREVKEEKKRL